ncbi:hypothetical protein C0J50_13240 [Silurus asotus]|uniref:Epidermal growth factor receptor substrate 15 n=1 Tax=Silurus asotus TaxID=30991 RepID=A0AAD5FTA4_SILAS|nr:hypothetical protein C0J50_13240 [Silurus asotus]
MMRFLLDCLRPGRARAGCGRENSVEIPTKEKDPGDEHELKDMEDVVAMEEGALQRDRAQCRDSQQALESLAKRRAQLREEIERLQEQRKQEGQLLLSLQEEQEELEQRVQEYDAELSRAREELQRLQEEIRSTRARVEEAHGRMGPLKHCIGDTYTEITEAKQRLGELITEMIAIEACAPEITSHQDIKSFSMAVDGGPREEDEDAEEHHNSVYEDEEALKRHSVKNEPLEQEQEDGPEKLQRSVENLKSSGSSSFTEITLTEFKEEDASPRSITSQHTGSADLEEEDFEIVQSLMSRPVHQSANKEFDFFHPDPFVDYDVFGDERFPKVDMTEFLSGDPFKGSDPFACDNLFDDVANSPLPQDSPLSEEGNAKESNPLPLSPESASKEEHDNISIVAHISATPNCSQSIDSGMFEQNVPELADPEKHVSYDICHQVGIEITVTQDADDRDLSSTLRNDSDLPTSPENEDGGRFDPIVCEHTDLHETESSSTVDSSFDGDFGTAEDHPEDEPEVEAGPSYVRRNQALYGLQRIDTSSYTSFPLSPDAYDPFSESNIDEKQPSFGSDHNTEKEFVCENVNAGYPSPSDREKDDVKSDPCTLELKEDHFSNTNEESHNEEPLNMDDHNFGDIYFFTVRLDPGSSDASPISPEVSERKKSEGDHVSPESEYDELDYVAPDEEDEDPKQCNLEDYPEESFDKEEVRPEQFPVSPEPNDPVKPEANNPHSIPNSVESKDQSDGLDSFECNIFESNIEFEPQSDKTENVDLDSSLTNCNTEPVVQYLISPVSGDTGMFATDGYKLCSRNPFSFDAGSIDHCDTIDPNPEPPDSSVIHESGSTETKLQSLVLLEPVLLGNPVHASNAKNPNADSGRLDSGYHEFNGPDPFNPIATDSCPVPAETDVGSITDDLEIELPNTTNLDEQAPDPFSPVSNDIAVFDLQSEPAVYDPVTKDSGLGCAASSGLLADSFSGSELDSFDPFSLMPGNSYTHCNTDMLVPVSVQDDSGSYDNRSSSWDSGVSQSPQLHCDFALNRADPLLPHEPNLVSPDTQNLSYSSGYSTADFFFQSDSSTLTDAGSLTPKVDKIAAQDQNSTVDVTAMEDLAEIEFFCSELSKMVASRSSDTVQQSVTEMLFGSNPDTAKFYPWDLENSNTDIKDTSSPTADFGHSLDEAEKPSLL